MRKLEVFPPQGTHIADSFFALQRPISPSLAKRRNLKTTELTSRKLGSEIPAHRCWW